MNIKTIVFDFDGVIADSKAVKRDAWRKVFSDRSPEDSELLGREVDARKGDRYDILRRTLTQLGIHGEELDRQVNRYADRYNELVQSGIKERGLFPGVPEMLGRLSEQYPLYVNTATPDDAIRATLVMFGLGGYFCGVFGSVSGSKSDNLRRIARQLNLRPSQVLMVGDEERDRDAALEVGAQFLGIADSINRWSQDGFPHPLLNSSAQLADFLERTA